jgi:hypothetical protein
MSSRDRDSLEPVSARSAIRVRDLIAPARTRGAIQFVGPARGAVRTGGSIAVPRPRDIRGRFRALGNLVQERRQQVPRLSLTTVGPASPGLPRGAGAAAARPRPGLVDPGRSGGAAARALVVDARGRFADAVPQSGSGLMTYLWNGEAALEEV